MADEVPGAQTPSIPPVRKPLADMLILIVLDGWGVGDKSKGDAIAEANLPTITKLNEYYPRVALQASGISVGLPWGEPGNSEVGHMTLGTGKVIYQNMPRITMAIQGGEFFANSVFLEACETAKKNKGALHLLGLVGKGGVHSNMEHLYALLELAKEQKLTKVFIHAFTDGRDSSPTSGVESFKELRLKLEKLKIGRVATLGGRYFGMDRNNNWDRVKKSYDSIVSGIGVKIDDPEKYLESSYKKEVYDEYIEPAVIWEKGAAVGSIKDGDSVIFFNYREDRARQITQAFTVPGFSKFPVTDFKDLYFATMVQYEDGLPAKVAFPPIEIKNSLGQLLSLSKLSQLRIAETEKFAHVTYFFNGGNEEPYIGEERVIVPSKDVPSFDKAPEMSAREITEKVLFFINKKKYNFILLNFANADIVGHTGNEQATIQAAEVIDECLDKIIRAALNVDAQILITADHGNAEETINSRTGEPDTEHSVNPVPLWYATSKNHHETPDTNPHYRVAGILSDVAPTILEIFDIKKPDEMTGESLLDALKKK
jgi:2,3-bisphosphoglycerate-independent phosphoglycerate mutase